MNRRGFLSSILAAGVAPAAIGSGVLMPVKQIWTPVRIQMFDPRMFTQEALRIFEQNIKFGNAINRDYPINFEKSIVVRRKSYLIPLDKLY